MTAKPDFSKMNGKELLAAYNDISPIPRKAKFSNLTEGIARCEAAWAEMPAAETNKEEVQGGGEPPTSPWPFTPVQGKERNEGPPTPPVVEVPTPTTEEGEEPTTAKAGRTSPATRSGAMATG